VDMGEAEGSQGALGVRAQSSELCGCGGVGVSLYSCVGGSTCLEPRGQELVRPQSKRVPSTWFLVVCAGLHLPPGWVAGPRLLAGFPPHCSRLAYASACSYRHCTQHRQCHQGHMAVCAPVSQALTANRTPNRSSKARPWTTHLPRVSARSKAALITSKQDPWRARPTWVEAC